MKRFLLMLSAAALTACVDSDPVGVESTSPIRPQASVAFNGSIRIGVVQNATSVSIGSAGDYTIRAKTSGAVLLSGSNGSVSITLTTPTVTRWYVQVVCATGTNLQGWIDKAIGHGHPWTTEQAPSGCFRLLLGDFVTTDPFSVRNNFRLLLLAQKFPSDLFPTTRIASVANYQLTRGATVVNTRQPPVLTSSTGIVTIAGARYRGAAEVIANSLGGVAGVNELPIDEYLYGVVPRELGPIAYPEIEAQKAQAIAARTYAMSGLGKRSADGYDLRATTDDQVYGGYAAEHPISNAAVEATRGIVLMYNGRLISALYSSASGGHTANNEEAFAASPAAYLRGIPDAERGKAFEHVPSIDVFRSHANATSLRNVKEGDFESNWSRFHRWKFEWDMNQMSSVISDFAKEPVGKVLAINVTERGPSGRVQRIEYVTEAGTFVDTKDRIRASLRFFNANNQKTNLLSTLFFVEPKVDPRTKEVVGFVAYGGGFGHGVGMAQTGAVGMAEKGHTYEEILKHYYRDVELRPAY